MVFYDQFFLHVPFCFEQIDNQKTRKGERMKKRLSVLGIAVLVGVAGFTGTASADDDAATLTEMFLKGKVKGSLKSYYFAETFDGAGKNDSQIWANGGHLGYTTGKFYGLRLGGEFQTSLVGSINDDDAKTASSMDAEGAVLSEAFLQYDLYNSKFKGGRQHYASPLVANSGSRLIKESFEMYSISNTDIPDTELTAGWVSKYQTRTDKSSYGDNAFVEYETNGSGRPGDFYDVGDDGMPILYMKNSSLKNLEVQAQYANVIDEVQGVYADATYTFDLEYKPYVAAQYFYTDWDDSIKDSNDLIGFKTGVNIVGADLFAGYTTAGGSAGDERVFRGLGQGAYYNYTTTTKTSGADAFEADTDAYQVGVEYTFADLTGTLRYTTFDRPVDGVDLDEWTLNLLYKFSGKLKNLSASVDFSVLDYENDDKDATDLRTRLIYAF